MEQQRGFGAKLCAALSFATLATFTLVATAQKAGKPAVPPRPNIPEARANLTSAGTGAAKIDAALAAANAVVPSPLYDLVAYNRNAAVPVPPKLPGQNIPAGTQSMCKGSPGYKNPMAAASGAAMSAEAASSNQTTTGASTNGSSSGAGSANSGVASQPTTSAPVACEGWVPVAGSKPATSSGSGDWIGNKGIGYGIEAFSVTPRLLPQGGKSWRGCLQLEYMAHIGGRGDTGWYPASTLVGTPGSGRFIEGIAFRLSGTCAASYSIKYNCHLRGLGDQTMMPGRGFCGTRGQGRALESFVVYVNGKDPNAVAASSTPGKSTVGFQISKGSNDGVGPDTWLGTRGQGIQLASLAVIPMLGGTPGWPPCLQIKYMAHVSGIGDTGWYDAPSYVQGGSEGGAFNLDGTCASTYTVEYQCQGRGLGDQPLVTGPTFCGTRGQGRRLEAVKLTVRQK